MSTFKMGHWYQIPFTSQRTSTVENNMHTESSENYNILTSENKSWNNA